MVPKPIPKPLASVVAQKAYTNSKHVPAPKIEKPGWKGLQFHSPECGKGVCLGVAGVSICISSL